MGVFGSLLGGVLGGASQDLLTGRPNRQIAQISPEASRNLDYLASEGEKGTSQIAQEHMEGTGEGEKFLQSPEQTAQKQTALGMATPQGLTSALKERSKRSYDSDINKMTQQMQHQAWATKQARLAGAFGPLAQQQAAQEEIYKKQTQDFYSRIKARNDAVSSIINPAGFMVGKLLGGKAAGAAPGAGGTDFSTSYSPEYASQLTYGGAAGPTATMGAI
jgi:hypothetical protein